MVDLNDTKILVTGGNGFIGSNFIELCMEMYNGIHIVNIDKLGVGSRNNLYFNQNENNLYTHIHKDLSTSEFMYESLNGQLANMKFDYVFHFAAESHVDRSIYDPASFVQNNAVGTTNLLSYLNTTNPNAKIICISTDEVYGHLGRNDPSFTSDSPLSPRSPYAASKASSDLIALAYKETFGSKIKITRCCNNFGPNQFSEKFIPTILNCIMNDQEIPVYGKGDNIREWIYVHDHNRAILEVATKFDDSKIIWNIGSGVEKTNLEVINDISAFLNKMPQIKFVEDRKGHDFRYSISNDVKYEPTPYLHALMETITYYKNGNL
jgi:dTDP-glucose 4,6-dehydratase